MDTFDTDREAVKRLIEQYDGEARAYVDYWAPVVHPVSCALVDELPDEGVRRVLDLGAGAGQLLPVLQEKYRDAAIVGIDRSEGMVALAEEDVLMAVMDALSLGFAPGAFDAVVMAFMLFHLPDPVAGLREARRVMRPGGTLAMTSWADDLASPAVRIWNEELDWHGAVPSEALSRLARHELMDTPEKVASLLERAGFVEPKVDVRDFSHTIELEDFIQLRMGVGSTRQRFESLSREQQRDCLARATEKLSGLAPEGFKIHMLIILTTARTPD